MELSANIDRLIASLEGFKAALPAQMGNSKNDQFEAIFNEAITLMAGYDEETNDLSTTQPLASSIPVEANAPAFYQLQSENWLLDDQDEARRNRPNLKAFMDITNLSVTDASELLYGVIGSNADLRDWSKIMASGNPVDAARAATGQLYKSDKEYELVNHSSYGEAEYDDVLNSLSLSSQTVLRQQGNFATVQRDDWRESALVVSGSGLILRGAGTSKAQLERTAWLFGFDLPEDVV